jgi:hypothetical protein
MVPILQQQAVVLHTGGKLQGFVPVTSSPRPSSSSCSAAAAATTSTTHEHFQSASSCRLRVLLPGDSSLTTMSSSCSPLTACKNLRSISPHSTRRRSRSMRIAAAVVEAPEASVAPVEEKKNSVEAPTEQQKMEELYEHTESRGGKIKADPLKIIMFQVFGNSSFSTREIRVLIASRSAIFFSVVFRFLLCACCSCSIQQVHSLIDPCKDDSSRFNVNS